MVPSLARTRAPTASVLGRRRLTARRGAGVGARIGGRVGRWGGAAAGPAVGGRRRGVLRRGGRVRRLNAARGLGRLRRRLVPGGGGGSRRRADGRRLGVRLRLVLRGV